jgi:hypothetical protein
LTTSVVAILPAIRVYVLLPEHIHYAMQEGVQSLQLIANKDAMASNQTRKN